MKQIPILFLALLLTAGCTKDENTSIIQPGYTIEIKHSIDLLQLEAAKPIQAAPDTTDNYIGTIGFFQLKANTSPPKIEYEGHYISNDNTKGAYALNYLTTFNSYEYKIIENKAGVLTITTKSLNSVDFFSSESDSRYYTYYGHPSNELTIKFKYNDKGDTLPTPFAVAALNKLLENMNSTKRFYEIIE